MKHVSVLALGAMTTIGVIPLGAYAAPVSHLHANAIATNNIAVMQHSVLLNTFGNFQGSMANIIHRNHAESNTDNASEKVIEEPTQSEEKTADKYGEMLYYGEYGDDGTVFQSGRSGGEEPLSSHVWIDWQHTQDYAKFDKFSKVDSDYDLITLGVAESPYYMNNGYSEFGGFGGLVFAHEEDEPVKLSENGGYIGLYSGYHAGGFGLAAAVDFGSLFSDASSAFDDCDFTNLWVGAGVNASYDIPFDEESILQPGLYFGYTWIHSTGYKSESGDDISVNDFNALELSPSLRAMTHITGGWYGGMSVRYVFNFTGGGNVRVAGNNLDNLDLMDYTEYGISFEKNTERFNFAASVRRREGGRTGWTSDLQVKYRF